ncbi:MAG: L,D-transpeptidase family protein [Pseudomonadota bacterium]
MTSRRSVLSMLGAGALVGCGPRLPEDATQIYTGAEVTSVQVLKERRHLYLMHDRSVLRAYEVDLGFSADGPKQFEGDGRTPEGDYYIDRRNPESSFYLSLGISYPDASDVAFARSQGRSPGGDIFIHGVRGRRGEKPRPPTRPDWTAGCIAVTNDQMREIYWMVAVGTPIRIVA